MKSPTWRCAAIAATLALAPAQALGDDGYTGSTPRSSVTPAPEIDRQAAEGIRAAKSAKALPTRGDRQAPLPDSLKERCRTQSGKSWDAMTAVERAHAQRVRAFCSGGF